MLFNMAYSQTDLDAIRAAIASGNLTVKINDRLVTYRSLDDLFRIEDRIEGDLNAGDVGMYPRYQVADFSE